jgi:PST family polysaccharide transporter
LGARGGGHRLWSGRGAVDALLVYAAHGLRFLAPLLLYPVLTRRFGVEAFGLYVAATALAMIVAVVVDYGASIAGPRDIASARETTGPVVGRTLALRAVLVPPACLIGLGLGLINPVLSGAGDVIGAAVALGVGQGASLLWFFQGMRDPAAAALVEVAAALAAAAVVLATPGLGVGGVLVVQAAGIGLGVVVCAAMMRRRCRPVWPQAGFVRRGLVEGFPLFVGRAVIMAYTGGGGLVVAALAGPAQAAVYGVADRLTAAVGSLLRPLAGLVGPRISTLLSEDAPAAFRTARWSLAVTPLLFLAAAAGLYGAAPAVVRLAVGDGFDEAVGVLRILVFVLPLVAASQVLGLQLMTPLRMDGRLALMVGIGGVATLAPALLLVPVFGATGMGWARILGEAVVVGACLACLRPYWRALFPAGGGRDVPAV